jgi:eukaryotic-like serine/threonine-protein kinase
MSPGGAMETDHPNPASRHDPQLPATAPERIGRFAITGVLGEGGMGLVYAARDAANERRVAIKVIRRELLDDPIVRERFWREARLVAGIADPHICRIEEGR